MNVTLMPPKLKLIYGKITDLVWYIFNLKKKQLNKHLSFIKTVFTIEKNYKYFDEKLYFLYSINYSINYQSSCIH